MIERFSVVILFILTTYMSDAQQQPVPAGGTAVGAGSASYTIGQVFYLEKTGSGSAMEGMNQPQNEAILPITLLSFKAELKLSGRVYLTWRTAVEQNNDFFTLERSGDGNEWATIKTLDGAGNSSTTISYLHIDEYPMLGISYYRLSQTDFDGTRVNFQIQAVNGSKNHSIVLYPNPVKNHIHLKGLFSNEDVRYEITDLDGKHLKVGRLDANSIEISKLPSGVYVLRLFKTEKLFLIKRIIKL